MTSEESLLRKQIEQCKAKITELHCKNTELELELRHAEKETTKRIFKKMYDLVSGETDCTITVNADDVKQIAKRYGVKL